MRLPVRETSKTYAAVRIATPEFKIDPVTKRKTPLLCWVDESNSLRRTDCGKQLFLAAAGRNEIGERPDGMDRLSFHNFYVHVDENERAVGLDVIPSRMYGSKLVPTHLIGVRTLKLRFEEDGSGVVRVVSRPVNTPAEDIVKVIRGLESLKGKPVKVNFNPIAGNAARVVSVSDGVVEVRLSKKDSRASVHNTDVDDIGE
jgi:hypothetical protein